MPPSAARTVPLYVFSQTTRQWAPLSSVTTRDVQANQDKSMPIDDPPQASTSKIDPDDPPPATLTCMTYNVFSGPSSSSIPHLSHRIKGAVRVIQQSGADILALQEVGSAFERALRREKWLRDNFALTGLREYFLASTGGRKADQSARGEDDGCLLAVRTVLLDPGGSGEAELLRLPGEQGKVLISVKTAQGIEIATSHFESLSSSTDTRFKQYTSTALHLSSSDIPSILLGDFNHAAYSELSPLLKTSRDLARPFTDDTAPPHPSQESHRHAPPPDLFRDKATFGELYPFFEGSRERRKPRRIDMIMTRESGQSDRGMRLEMVKNWTSGTKPLVVEKKMKPPRPDQTSPTGENKSARVKTKLVKLRCQEGKGGHLYASDHSAVIATFAVHKPA